MGKRKVMWKTKGMNQDLSVSAFNPEFSFENRNLRLSTNEGNTLMSWVNEKGTLNIKDDSDTNIVLEGIPIGTAVLNHKLIVFTTSTSSDTKSTKVTEGKHDYIYVLEYKDIDKTKMSVNNIYNGNLNLSTLYPLETTVSYEAEHILKVYWTDGVNQPRMINISEDPNSWIGEDANLDFFFDFVPAIKFPDLVTVEKNVASSGLFAPGVILYCFTYVNKYGQQSNVVWISTLYYLTHSDRGASPEDKVSNSFTITIKNPNEKFNYIRLYSILRTSLDATPIVKLLEDLVIKDAEVKTEGGSESHIIVYTDNGTTGTTIDPYELLYAGGREITAKTIIDKDNTLFLGNIRLINTLVRDILNYFDKNRSSSGHYGIEFKNSSDGVYSKQLEMPIPNGIYSFTNLLNTHAANEITTFKGGDTYRFGFQLQKRTGEWLEPIYLDDLRNTLYPNSNTYSTTVNLVYAKASIGLNAFIASLPEDSELKTEFYNIFKRIRPVIVFPTIGDREVLCLGVLNPTVFNALDRIDNSPFAQASWFFRPYMTSEMSKSININPYGDDPSSTSDPIVLVYPIDDLVATLHDSKRPYQLEYIPETYFRDTTKVHQVWAFTVDIKKEYIEDILTYRRVKVVKWTYGPGPRGWQEYSSEDVYVEFDGAIKMVPNVDDSGNSVTPSEEGDTVLYTLVSSTPWQTLLAVPGPVDYIVIDAFVAGESGTAYGYCQDGVTYLPNDMKTSHGLLYLQSEDPNVTLFTYEPFWNAPSKRYLGKVVFKNYKPESNTEEPETSSSENTSEIEPTYDNSTSGDGLAFTHYDSIYSNSDLTTDEAADNTMAQRLIEIQGGVNQFKNPFSYNKKEVDDNAYKSNTLFFIDQSIVTLNSPDIDFDTEVQVYGMDNLHLRIIGAIPITANISAHHIETSSGKLGTYHNMGVNSLVFGHGESNKTVKHLGITAGLRLVSDYLWNDTLGYWKDGEWLTSLAIQNYLVYPWQSSGSLANDSRGNEEAASVLKTKKESSLMYSFNTEYFSTHSISYSETFNIGTQLHLTENSEVLNMRLSLKAEGSLEINYYPNVDKILYNSDGYKALMDTNDSNLAGYYNTLTSPVSMRYLSTSHAIMSLMTDSDGKIPILPYGKFTVEGTEEKYGECKVKLSGKPYWDYDNTITFREQVGIDISNLFKYGSTHKAHNWLWLGEIYKSTPKNLFGGTGKEAIRSNKWLIGGEAVDLLQGTNPTLYWTQGDTYFQRYDCIKTFAMTPEDTNLIVEVLSFMCETHVNLDGRFDRNRGLIDNTDMNPLKNFNQINPVYSQRDNFFTSRRLELDDVEDLRYPNQFTWSKTKNLGEDVDLWTNVTLASTEALDGDKGEITSLLRFNNQIIAFLDSGISLILYNENVQISTEDGVPIEIANSGKVQGKRYLSNSIGCSNKYSIANTPSGIYFMDSNDKGIYLFNGELQNISGTFGFNSWCKQNIPDTNSVWNPVNFGEVGNLTNFKAIYDKLNLDVMWINDKEAIAYSEKLGTFTSFYDYGHAPYFCNLDDTGVWINPIEHTYTVKEGNPPQPVLNKVIQTELFKHQAGEYCNFFGNNYLYSMILVGNPEPTLDKIFTNLEFRACVDTDYIEETKEVVDEETGETTTVKTGKIIPILPFDSLETWNEHQHGITSLENKIGHASMVHHVDDEDNSSSALKRKFRIWRSDIPRDNHSIDPTEEAKKGIFRFKKRPNDRMRNPWLYIKLLKKAAKEEDYLKRTEVHDIQMSYFT